MSPLSKISALHAKAIYNSFQQDRFGINSCKGKQEHDHLYQILKVAEYYEINKEQDRTMTVYFGETREKYDLNREIENSYCPKVNELINAL